MDFKTAARAASIPVAALALVTLAFELFELAVEYFNQPTLALLALLLVPVSLVLFAAAGFIAAKRYGADKTEGAFAGGFAGLVYGIISSILKVIFLVLLYRLNPNAQDPVATLLASVLPAGAQVLVTKLICIGVVIPVSIVGGLVAGYIGAFVAKLKSR